MSYITYIKNKKTKAKFISFFSALIILGLVVMPALVLADNSDIQKVSEVRLKISEIGVDAVIKNMGVTSDGAMAVPNNNIDVGWFSFGARPGETGTAVIGAHNRLNSKPGIFARLDELKKGDTLSVVNSSGTSIYFVVRDIHTYDALDTNTGVFESSGSGTHLNLITCSGAWDSKTKSHTTRLVIFTDLV